MAEWVKVEDRLPALRVFTPEEQCQPKYLTEEIRANLVAHAHAESADVLVYGRGKRYDGNLKWSYGIGWLDTSAGRAPTWNVQDEYGEPREVTHWMPLPEAPGG